ncbi:futalosine hydrolase [Salidesulfovibrio brasiliensis]|uniref:futalosine hydrolase n=1 Tax=Salidesulfovibrio brasiliensis TaxID=221711 RepID=UPI0006D1A467|nr:futalosine hydrolase [Salidesulfovibrio brasiliensis]
MLALVTAAEKEMQAALGKFDAPHVREGEIVSWSHKGRDWLLAVAGVGPINAGITAGRLLERGAKGMVNAGIAGSFDTKRLPTQSVCAVRCETWPDFGLATADGVDPEGIRFSQAERNGVSVTNRVCMDPVAAAREMGLTLPWLETASSLTVSASTGTPELAERLKNEFDADLENMEGFALALACFRAGVPFLEIRTVSNRVGSREGWDFGGALTALKVACAAIVAA